MHQALYRKWRPKDFTSVYGQEHITSVLRYEITNNRVNHAYLFCGSRGTGKTTCAKLLAKAVNCLSPQNGNPCGICEACKAIENETTTDVIEMDAASNTGVDYIRDIRETVMYSPSMLKNRVYIIDEVHMLTQSAFNALLKTLEEPPSQVIFILATTEQQKIPATILSRCQKFEFKRIAADVIADRLMFIAENENIKIDRDAAKFIARMAQGGMRDAISLLELCVGDGKDITVAAVKSITGASGREQAAEVAKAVVEKSPDRLFSVIENVISSSKDILVFWQELMDLYRDLLVFKTTKNPASYLDLTDNETEMLRDISGKFSAASLLRQCTVIEKAFENMQRSDSSKRLCAEMALLKMCDEKLDTTPEGIVARLSALEEKLALIIANGVSVPTEQALAQKSAPETMFKKSVTPEKPQTMTRPAEPKKAVRTGMKPVSWWIEAAKQISATDSSLYPFMKTSRAFESNGKILVRVEGAMGMMMLDTTEMKNMLSAYSRTLSDTPVAPNDFQFIEVTPEIEKNPIDELESTEDN